MNATRHVAGMTMSVPGTSMDSRMTAFCGRNRTVFTKIPPRETFAPVRSSGSIAVDLTRNEAWTR